MTDPSDAIGDLMPSGRLRMRPPRLVPGVVAIGFSLSTGIWLIDTRPTDHVELAAIPTVQRAVPTVRREASAWLDPASLGVVPIVLSESAPVSSTFRWLTPPEPIVTAAAPPVVVAVAEQAEAESLATEPPSPPARAEAPEPEPEIAQDVPLPTPRPQELRLPPVQTTERAPSRLLGRRNRTLAPQTAAVDTRSVFEKLFGIGQPTAPGPALAYAAPGGSIFGNARLTDAPSPSVDRFTAVYDISAHTVTMPNGTKLEAHSGLGSRLDDPSYVHERMRGPTPPHVYDLTPREQLFHGVRALRLNPVGGRGTFGRTGLLAHTFMLGPNGDSNGCVSFRNYDAFLQAYLNGQVKRLVVVARSS